MRRAGLAALALLFLLGREARAASGDQQAGIGLLERGKPVEAAALLVPAARGQREAELLYWTGRALEAAGQRSSALERYLATLLARPQRLHREAARRLSLDPAFPLSAGGLEQLAGLDLTALEPGVQEGLRHRLALHYLRTGQVAPATALFAKLQPRPQILYLRALVALHQRRVGEMRRLLLAARRGDDRDVGELATLALARLELEEGRLDAAARHYRAVPFGSHLFFRSRQELAWLHLARGEAREALAQSVVLRAPGSRRRYWPDRELVEAAALLQLCHAEAAGARARQARLRLERDIKRLAVFLRAGRDTRLYYVEATGSAVRGGRGVLGQAVVALLADPGFRQVFGVVRQLQRERRLLLRTGSEALAEQLSEELDQRLVEAQERAGGAVKRILARLLSELKGLRLRAQELLFDVEGRAIQRAIRRRSTEGRGQASPPRRPRPVAPGRQLHWPFQREYWADEIEHLTVSLPAACP